MKKAPEKNLIVDIGMHKGEDTAFYLHLGYSVVAVDADPTLVEEARTRFSTYIDAGKLTLENCAISDRAGDVEFNLSATSLFNSLHHKVSNRKNSLKGTVRVPARTLSSIFADHGVPHYCKIDIEGYDAIALRTIAGVSPLPTFISCETECLGENETITEAQSLETLMVLKELGYSKFKLIDQRSLAALTPTSRAYAPTAVSRAIKRLKSLAGVPRVRESLQKKFGYQFSKDASGPFGEDSNGRWMGFDDARNSLLRNRALYFQQPKASSYGFWCDWHAKQ